MSWKKFHVEWLWPWRRRWQRWNWPARQAPARGARTAGRWCCQSRGGARRCGQSWGGTGGRGAIDDTDTGKRMDYVILVSEMQEAILLKRWMNCIDFVCIWDYWSSKNSVRLFRGRTYVYISFLLPLFLWQYYCEKSQISSQLKNTFFWSVISLKFWIHLNTDFFQQPVMPVNQVVFPQVVQVPYLQQQQVGGKDSWRNFDLQL